MSEPVFECDTPEAWTELLRSERVSAAGMIAELRLAREAVAHLGSDNQNLLAEVARLTALLAGSENKG